LLIVGRMWGALTGAHAWYEALGFVDVWWWKTQVALSLKFGGGALACLLMRAHLEAVRRSFRSVVVPGTVGNLELTGAVPDHTIAIVLWGVALATGVLLTVPIDDWRPLASVLDAQPLGEYDPYFQYDMSFWTSWLPFEMQLYSWALLLHAITSLITIVAYVITRGITTDGSGLRTTRHARRHITVLGAMLLLLIGWSYRIDGFDRLVHGTGAMNAFGFADHRIGLPGGIVMQVICLGAACVVVWSAWSRQPRAAVAAVTTVLLMALLLRQGMPFLADSIAGGSDSMAREIRYREAGASYTRHAFESYRVIVAAPSDTAVLASTPLWDRATVPRAGVGRLGALLAWNASQGMPQATVFDALRAPGLLPTWRAIPIDMTSDSPLRDVTARDGLTLPPIAVSDSGRGYAIVSDPSRRIAAPSIASRSSRFAFALHQQNPRLLFGAVPQPAPILVTTRDVRERVAMLVPMLRGGAHVVPQVYADSLWWSLDLYAVSATFPLSEHLLLDGDDVSAAQFALTAIVNAHTGRVILVADTGTPALARDALWRLRTHIVSIGAVPEAMRRALPPRADALEIEATVAARYGSLTVQEDTSALNRRGGPLNEFALVHGELPDSSIVSDALVPVWLPERQAYALSAAAIDSRGVVRGVMLAPGGMDRRTRWRPTADGARYEDIMRGAKETSDSLRQPGSLIGARRGTTRVLPGTGAARFVTPYFNMRDGRPSQLAAVMVTDGAHRGVAASIPAAAVNLRDVDPNTAPNSAAAALYRQMRGSLQRGAWGEFGATFEALGRALGVPRDSVRR
jgi:uncharacterized protein